MKSISRNIACLTLIILGFAMIITQLVMIRSFMDVFYGNELVIGLVIGTWMILTGLGAWTGRFYKRKKEFTTLLVLQLLMAILPVLSYYFAYQLTGLWTTYGSLTSPVQIVSISVLTLVPYCFISGFTFNFLTGLISEQTGSNTAGRAYFLESAGSFFGAVLFCVAASFALQGFIVLMILLAINLLLAVIISFQAERRILTWITGIVVLFSFGIIIISDISTSAVKSIYHEQEMVLSKETPYGHIVVTKSDNQYNFFENRTLLFTTDNLIQNEEAVHYAMLQRPSAKEILLISGGISGMTNEILKFPVNRVDYIEADPWLFRAGLAYNPGFKRTRIHVHLMDPRRFLRKTDHFYDVVLTNLPEPSSAQTNRFYTKEFFRQVKEKMKPGAVISTGILPTTEYVGVESGAVNSVLYVTLKSVFKNVLIIPGGKNYFLASDSELSIRIAELEERSGINNSYVSRYYLDDELLKKRSESITSALNKRAGINHDFSPVSYFLQVKYWLSQFGIGIYVVAGIILLVLVVVVASLNPVSLGIFTGGFTAASLQFIILLAWQVFYGFVYRYAGLVFGAFMLGIAAGTWLVPRVFNVSYRNYTKIVIILSVYSLIVLGILALLNSFQVKDWLINFLIFGMVADLGTLVGALYLFASEIRKRNMAVLVSENYSADLAGSALGLLIISSLLFPLLGFIKVCILLFLLNIAAALLMFLKRKKYS